MIGKPTMFVKEKLLLVPELKEALWEKSLKRALRKRLLTKNQTNWEGPYNVKKRISDLLPGRPYRSWSSITAEMVCQFKKNRLKEGAVEH